MVYAYDRNIQMPTKDLYNTQMMAMAINAAKDLYDDALKRLDDLNKMYSDFYSPSDKDMENWLKYVVNPIKSQIDDLYARGIDPIRSAEGLAILARASRNLPYDVMNKLKQSSKVGEKYVENASKLLSLNLYDPEYEKFLGRDLKNWDSLNPENGVWQWSSPSEAPSLGEYTSPMYEKRSARPLTKEEVINSGAPYDPMQDYTGYLESDLLNNAVENLPAFLNTSYGRYQQHLAKLQLEDVARAHGIDPNSITEGLVNRQLAENIAGANTRWIIAPTGEAKPSAIASRRSYSGGGGGYSGIGNENNTEYGYSTQIRFFNEGIANLLGTPVSVVQNELNSNSNILNKILGNLDAIIRRHMNGNNVNINGVLRDLSFRKSPQLIAKVLQLSQTGDADKQNDMYTLPKEELNNLLSANHLFGRIKGAGIHTRDKSSVTKNIVNKYKNYNRNEIKIAPTGYVITYLSKDGSIKQYAKVNIFAAKHDANGNTIKSANDEMYIDLGTVSTTVENGSYNGKRKPVQIDRNLSTARDSGFEAVDDEKAANKTQTIFEDYLY